jgi:glycerol-3-phosphate acyltransferase PlsY
MREGVLLVLVFIAAYFLGSIPVAWIITRVHTGQDLREMGSGNVGVMNVGLSVHRWAGLLVFAAEISKGVIAVLVPRALGLGEASIYLSALGVVIGTRWPVWLRFQGGRGNSAGVGALLVLSWETLAAGGVVWILVRLLSGSSFWATRVAFVIWPALFGWFMRSWLGFFFAGVLVVLYLSTQHVSSDDHLIIKERWPSLAAFLFSPPRDEE